MDALDQIPGGGRRGDPAWAEGLVQRQRQLLDAMATLPAETRSVMLMHYFQGMRLPDIAAALGKTVRP